MLKQKKNSSAIRILIMINASFDSSFLVNNKLREVVKYNLLVFDFLTNDYCVRFKNRSFTILEWSRVAKAMLLLHALYSLAITLKKLGILFITNSLK